MTTSLNNSLLDGARKTNPRSNRRTTVVACAAVVTLLVSVPLVRYSVGKDKLSQIDGDSFDNMVAKNQESASPQCYSYINATCTAVADTKCTEFNGQCDGSECACVGGCAGADGFCYTESNTKLNKQPLAITNQAYDNYQLYLPDVSLRHMMRVSRWFTPFNHGQTFNIHKLPGGLYNGHNLYLLTLDYWPNWAVTIDQSPADRTESSPYGLYAIDMTAPPCPQCAHLSPLDFAVRLCNMKKLTGLDAIKIGRTLDNGHSVWARLTSDSVLVIGWDTRAENQDPGGEGYWKLSEPTIDDTFQDCNP